MTQPKLHSERYTTEVLEADVGYHMIMCDTKTGNKIVCKNLCEKSTWKHDRLTEFMNSLTDIQLNDSLKVKNHPPAK